jgi:hypothetical protein
MSASARLFSVPREGKCSICHQMLGNGELAVNPKILAASNEGKLSKIIGRDGSQLIPTKKLKNSACHKICLERLRSLRPHKEKLSDVSVKNISFKTSTKTKKPKEEEKSKERKEPIISFIFGAIASYFAPLVLTKGAVPDLRVCLTALPIGAAVLVGQAMGKGSFNKADLKKCLLIGGLGSALALPLCVLSLSSSVATVAGVVVGGFTAYHETKLYYDSMVKSAECFSRVFIYGACSFLASVCSAAIIGSFIKV